LLLVLCLSQLVARDSFAGGVEVQRDAIEALDATLDEMLLQLSELEQQYRSELAEVERLKQQKRNWADDLVLQDALRTARRSADALSALAARIRVTQAQRREAQLALLNACDTQLTELELQLVEAKNPEKQLALIESLDTYQQIREQYKHAAGSAIAELELPDFSSLQLEDPDELRAALAELSDHEAELERQLRQLKERIESLERRQRLLARAEDSSDESRLFNEDSRSTRVAAAQPNEESKTTTPSTDTQTRPPTELPDFSEGQSDDLVLDGLPAAENDGDDPMAGFDSINGGRDETPVPLTPGGTVDAVTQPLELPSQNYQAPASIEREEADIALLVGSRREAMDVAATDELATLQAQRRSLEQTLGEIDERGRALREQLQLLGVSE
jgi:hypothetical protein